LIGVNVYVAGPFAIISFNIVTAEVTVFASSIVAKGNPVTCLTFF